jgi:hypothetical protein
MASKPQKDKHLTDLRRERTIASNTVRRLIASMLSNEAPTVYPDGTPSWWPFWSDCLVRRTRECVAAARRVEEWEARLRQGGRS